MGLDFPRPARHSKFVSIQVFITRIHSQVWEHMQRQLSPILQIAIHWDLAKLFQRALA